MGPIKFKDGTTIMSLKEVPQPIIKEVQSLADSGMSTSGDLFRFFKSLLTSELMIDGWLSLKKLSKEQQRLVWGVTTQVYRKRGISNPWPILVKSYTIDPKSKIKYVNVTESNKDKTLTYDWQYHLKSTLLHAKKLEKLLSDKYEFMEYFLYKNSFETLPILLNEFITEFSKYDPRDRTDQAIFPDALKGIKKKNVKNIESRSFGKSLVFGLKNLVGKPLYKFSAAVCSVVYLEEPIVDPDVLRKDCSGMVRKKV